MVITQSLPRAIVEPNETKWSRQKYLAARRFHAIIMLLVDEMSNRNI